ncbi:T9SS C-terminal target domain-containing protein [Chryseobacterium indologenes]|uniref:S8 family peptidase n=1 Tax=Chryseobacterium TaxID=59732 RepID=UPI0004835135|nr:MULTISPECIES: S8 family peptidase [Chryseobacterium]AYZ36446.1 T9SS C-terminal target domain-containing protein [Chryseobacterium indologenes]MBF6645111.1 S8 family peptidase [Chryseobacterium indologenes]MBU3046572.1 S8 family peptidase [Chryseobacterium indologenes]MEB4759394.1 S8 family peptidase [Chryseobacterium indologenes]QQQ71211.1 S8 family peptidase [Chryseobacterium indologenes]
MKKILLFCILTGYSSAFAQTELVFVYFKDKPNKAAFFANPLSELTQKSLNRRLTLGISLNDQDAPIEQSYIQNLQNLGFTVTDYSKWLNGAAVNATPAQITLLQTQPFVLSVESFARNTSTTVKQLPSHKWDDQATSNKILTNFNYGSGSAQIDQVNIRPLHIAGFTGTGISIAVIDSGFPTVNTGAAFSKIWNNNQIKAGYDFVTKTGDIYNTTLNSHGTAILGAIGGYLENIFVGSAPDADFYLYRTENAAVEIPEEELYWIEAAEEADRKGVEIITSSLGYHVFDDSKYNYTYADMNGSISFIARAAGIAAEKGIFVLAAAGNSGDKPWHYLLTPSDNTNVFSIGGVDSTGNSSVFSSFGPNSAGVIKPDGSAQGTNTTTVFDNATITVNGTSIATPIAAGGVACFIQAFPNMNREQIRTKLRQTASLYPNHTDQMGYGILNFGSIYNAVLGTSESSKKEILKIYPNPVKNILHIVSKDEIQSLEIYDNLGRLLQKNNQQKSVNVEGFAKGTYYLKIRTKNKTIYEKLIKD